MTFVIVRCFSMKDNGLCKWSAGLKVMNFQFCTEPIRLFNIFIFPSIVADELAVLQRRNVVELPTETRIPFTFCCSQCFNFLRCQFLKLFHKQPA